MLVKAVEASYSDAPLRPSYTCSRKGGPK
jgi:hypothetical protein